MDKLVSVIIPTFNRKELTDNAVESVVTAYPSLVEIIVVDDCGRIPYMFDERNLNGVPVCVIRLDKNVGAGMARKSGVVHASAKFVAFLDSDDRYDERWIDNVIKLVQFDADLLNRLVLVAGITQGERGIGGLARRILADMPPPLQLAASRLVATLFNPFYTPSIVVSRELCFFKDGLRNCEDYYSTATAIFGAHNIILPKVVACHLGRIPNSPGGESAARKKMFRGEMEVRFSMLRETWVPFFYKLLVPLGMLYQWCRHAVKRFFLY